MTARRRVSTKARIALFAREGGTCHLCGGIVQAGEAWDLSHEIPLALGGADDQSNWRVAHRKCHRVETSTKDVPAIAKAKRREAAHIGAKAPSAKPIQSAGFRPAPPQRKANTLGPKTAQIRAMRESSHANDQG
jgi:5-methylcytosine-specific restriction enzyme A